MLKKIASSRKSQLFCYYFSPEGLLLARCGCVILEGAVVLSLTLWDNPCPLVGIVRSNGGYISLQEATTVFPRLAHDGVAPALVVEPVVPLAPEVETAIELDFGQQVVAGLGTLLQLWVALLVGIEEQLLSLGILTQMAIGLSLDIIHLGRTEQRE